MPGSAPRATLDNPYGPLVTFRTEDVLPPSALYISMNDTLVANFVCSLAGTAFNLITRILMPDGTIQVEAYTSTALVNPLVPSIVLPPVEGYLLSLVINRTDVVNCNAFCTAALFRGAVSVPLITLPPNAGAVFVQGEVSVASGLAWPNSPVMAGGTGAGTMRNIPLAITTGTNWTLTVTLPLRWEVIAVQFLFGTSPNVATRQVTLLVTDPTGHGVVRVPSTVTQAAGINLAYYFYIGAPDSAAGSAYVVTALPQGLALDIGFTVASSIINLDALDVVSAASVYVKEWLGVGHY